MASDFSITERRLIQSLMRRKPDSYIAQILDRAEKEIAYFIEVITGGEIVSCSQKLRSQSAEDLRIKQIEERQRRLKKANLELEDRQRSVVTRSRGGSLTKEHKKFKTIDLDLKERIAVRIDHKTVVYVRPGTDIEAVRKKYSNRFQEFIGREKEFASKKYMR
jgi:hypothetical protein